MNKLWEFFENMDEFVYVSDMDTYELIYMNKKMMNKYGYHSQEEFSGKKCYEVLWNCTVSCALCNNGKLREGYFEECRCFHPVLNRHLILKDTMVNEDGRRLRVGIAIDADTQEWQNSIIRRFQNLEAIANEGIRLALQAPLPDQSLGVILEYLGKALKGERTYIFERNESGGDDNTYEWVAGGIRPEKDNLQNLPPEASAEWYRNFSEGKNIVIDDLEDAREKYPQQYEILKRQNIRSLVVVPLYDESKNIGFYGIDNLPIEFFDYASNMLQIMGHFIISTLKRRNLVRELQQMSYNDQLTQIGNRYAMNAYIEKIQDGESVGVVYCDITGLKRVNDTEGHEAGDKLILRACMSLKSVFDGFGLFRIGGDELLVLCERIGEEELQERVGMLKGVMKENDVLMAVGMAWHSEGRANIGGLLLESERLMYEDKAAFYRTMGEGKRHTDGMR